MSAAREQNHLRDFHRMPGFCGQVGANNWRPAVIMKRLLGLAKATAHPDTEFDLEFAGDGGRRFHFRAKLDAIEQILANLSQLALASRAKHHAGKTQVVSAEEVHQYLVQRDPFGSAILLRLVNPHGVAYNFAFPVAAANDIADRLKSESTKVDSVGTA
jgi:hypothetical protein